MISKKKTTEEREMMNKNKILSVVVAFMLVISSLETNGFAAGKITTDKTKKPVISNATKKSEAKLNAGFRLISTKKLAETGSTLLTYKHVKSGAELLYMMNNDVNKLFDINFRTLPKDSTGVNHIIEHSVLCGSKNYPVKSPFLQMSKQSLSTFLNALTGPDFTMYPSGSKNEKDFQNLMGVYMDAVFYPNMLKDPNIFKQEGWSYQLEALSDELKYNGVVYNEMKGALSSPFSLGSYKINESLFPDTPYRFVAGGDPDVIPTLTWEKLQKTYKQNYTPSNCCIFLYGKLDIDKTLKFLNDNYLKNFNAVKVDTTIPLQKPFDQKKTMTADYGVSNEETTDGKTFLYYNYVIGTMLDRETVIAFPFLNQLLLGDENAVLTKALKDSKLADIVSGSFDASGIQPVYKISVLNNEEQNREKIENIIEQTLNKIVKEGFEKKSFEKLFSGYEIQYRQSKFKNESVGLDYDLAAMSGWLYGGDPTMYLHQEDVLDQLKREANNGYFEKLIKKYLIDNNHASIVVLRPVKGLEQSKAVADAKKQQDFKNELTAAELEKLVKQSIALTKWKDQPDSPKTLAKMPSLTRADLNIEMVEIPTKIDTVDGIKMRNHPVAYNGLAQVAMYLESNTIPQNQLKYLTLLCSLLGNTDTSLHGYAQLSDEINRKTQGIVFMASTDTKIDDINAYTPRVITFTTALDTNVKDTMEIYKEIIGSTTFTDKERVRFLTKQTRSLLDMLYRNAGSLVGMERIGNYLSEKGKYTTETAGIGYYHFISDLDDNFDARWEEVRKNLLEVKTLLFNKNNLVVSYTGGDKGYKSCKEGIKALSEVLENSTPKAYRYQFETKDVNEAIKMPVKVQNIYKAGNMKKAGIKYNPKMKVLEKILNSDYLWNEVRVKGGAYGVNVSINENGVVLFTSSEDPNLKETLDRFDKSVDYIRNFVADEKMMTNFIIGAIGNVNTQMDPGTQGILADSMYFVGTSKDEILDQYREMLKTTAADIRGYADMLDKVLKQNLHCVVGGDDKINECKDSFDRVKSLSELLQ